MLFITRSLATALGLSMLSAFTLKGMEARPLHAIYVTKDQYEEPYLSAQKYLTKKLVNINLLNERFNNAYGEVNYHPDEYLYTKKEIILKKYDAKRSSACKQGIISGLVVLASGGAFGWAVHNDQPMISTVAFWTCMGSGISALVNWYTFFSMPHRNSISNEAIITDALQAKIKKKKLEIALNQEKLDAMNRIKN